MCLFYILEMSVIWLEGVGVRLFWKCKKMDIHTLDCDDILI